MAKAPRKDDATLVAEYMQALDHPLKAEMEALRTLITGVHPNIRERIKWNAPSYHIDNQDFLTFNHRMTDKVHLIFHHPAIVTIASPLLEGDYKDRRMTYFSSTAAVEAGRAELERVIGELVGMVSTTASK